MPQSIHFNDPFWQGGQALIDSRQVVAPAQAIFFAFVGKHHDGHDFVANLYNRGLRRFVISQADFDQKPFPLAQFCLTDNPTLLLQNWAAWHRQRFHIPVIGITGSNGKTIVKEWLSKLLDEYYIIAKSPKSYNSQIGVPLSVLGIQKKHNLAIFEAGISTKGEMTRIARILSPQIGIFTNIGNAHEEGFANEAEKIREKLELFESAEVLIYNSKYENIHKAILASSALSQKMRYRWGEESDAQIRIKLSLKGQQNSQFSLLWQGKPVILQLPFSNQVAIENCGHCIILMLHLGYNSDEIQRQVERLRDLPMRLELKEGIRGCTLIDDTYNNDLTGLLVALDFLRQKHEEKTHYHQRTGKTVILSDILQSGQSPDSLYQNLVQQLLRLQINKFIGIGTALFQHQRLFEAIPETHFFSTTDQFVEQFDQQLYFQNETILVKGARHFGLERIIRLLRKGLHNTVLEIHLNAIAHNFDFYRGLLKPDTKIMAMVKAFAYGSGSFEIANLLQYRNIAYLGVAYVDEGVALRQRGIRSPIMILNVSEQNFEQLIRYEIDPIVYSFSILRRLIDFLKHRQVQKPLPIHIELDTGMHRLGFDSKDINLLSELLVSHKALLEVRSVLSHLVASDEAKHNNFSLTQIQQFQEFANKLEDSLGYSIIRHILNSAGITRFPEAQFDMVRLGIGLHGIDPSGIHSQQLQQVASLKTVISQIKTIALGETIGYNRQGQLQRDSRIATIAIGYADGFLRVFGNGVGQVLINGQLAPIVGNICMDMSFVDITDIPSAREGEEVLIFGTDLPISQVAKAANTIPYEILTNISARVPRVFYED